MISDFNSQTAGNQPVFVSLQGDGIYKNAKILTGDEIKELIKKYGLESKFKETADGTKFSQSLRQMKKKPRVGKNYVMEDFFESGQTIAFVGKQKSGKSFVFVDNLLAIASGGKIGSRFNVKTKQEVFLIDSEMPEGKNLDRIDDMKTLHQNHDELDKNFNMICLRERGEKLDLSNPKDQERVENGLRANSAKLLALDNLGGMIPYGSEGNVRVWRKVFEWFRKLNAKGITVLFVHHENKKGEIRGTNKISDDVDLSISLQRPEGWNPADGNIVEFHFADVRFLTEDQVIPFSIKYHTENGVFKRDIQNIDPESGEAIEILISDEEIQKYNLDSELKIEIFTVAISGEIFKRKNFENDEKGRSPSTLKKYLKELCDDRVLVMEGYEYQLHPDLKKLYG